MTVPFYNDNANRAYPFVDNGPLDMLYSGGGQLTLPDSAVVDFTVIIGPDGAFEEDTHRVYLYEINRASSQLNYIFRFSAPALADHQLTFCRLVDDIEFSTSFAETTLIEGIGGSISLECDGLVAEAWFTTGPMADLVGLLSDGEYLRRADGNVYIEPARIQNLYKAIIRSANLANARRVTVTEHESCTSETPGSLDPELIPYTECMAGDLRIKAGYNCFIRQNTNDNSILIGAGVGEGEGEPCSEVPLFDGETTPTGSTLLTGGPGCDEIIKTINGVAGPLMSFLGGVGVQIRPSDVDPHELVVDVNLRGLVICTDFPPSYSSSSMSYSCGAGECPDDACYVISGYTDDFFAICQDCISGSSASIEAADFFTIDDELYRVHAALRRMTADATITDVTTKKAGLGRQAANQLVITDYVNRIVNQTRFAETTVSIQDNVILAAQIFIESLVNIDDEIKRTLAALRTAETTAAIADTVLRIGDQLRHFTDTVTIRDSVIASGISLREAEDTLSITDGVIIASGTAITVEPDDIMISDNVIFVSALNRIEETTASIDDEIIRTFAALRAADATAAILDVTVITAGVERQTFDTIAVEDAVIISGASIRQLEDTLAITESVQLTLAALRELGADVTISDEVSRLIAALRDTTATATVNDTLVLTVGMSRQSDDTATVTDSIILAGTAARQLFSTAALGDAVLRARGVPYNVDVGLGMDDGLIIVTGAARKATDTVGLVDEFAKRAGLTRQTDNDVAIQDAIFRLGTLLRDTEDSAGILDNIFMLRTSRTSKFFADDAIVSDFIDLVAQSLRDASDNLSIADTVLKAAATFRDEQDFVTLTDNERLTTIRAREAVVTTAVEDELYHTFAAARSEQATVALLDNVTEVGTYGRTIPETAALLDNVTEVGTYGRVMTDIIGMSIHTTDAWNVSRTVTDTIVVADNIDQTHTAKREFTDTVGFDDDYDIVGSSDTDPCSGTWTTWRKAGTGTSGWTSGASWNSPGNITADDGNYADCSPDAFGAEHLIATNFGFSAEVASDATINCVEMRLQRYAANADRIYDSSVYLTEDGSFFGIGDNQAAAAAWDTSDEIVTYAPGSTWGLDLSATEVRSTGFGCGVSIEEQGGDSTGYVDYIELRVNYTEA